MNTDSIITEDDLLPFSDWTKNNKSNCYQTLSISEMVLNLSEQERYIVFRTAARLLNIGMTEEEHALTNVKPKKR